MSDLAQRIADLSPAKRALLNRQLEEKPGVMAPIALIGLGCRFPGASNPGAFWQLLRDGVDAITEVPRDRWDVNLFYDPNPAVPGKMNTRWGGFLEQVDQFDPRFFGISPREAARMDPQQRLLLEVAWEALEDAGQVPERLAGTPTGVFIGISSNDYGLMVLHDPHRIDAYAGTGNALSIAANRISYLFNFRGPSVAVDTACSSSLVAVHFACRSLWNGEASLALAGGVNVILSPAGAINFTKAGAMAPDGRCKAFDARANGYVRGEGAGMVVLKPLPRALADGDPIYAVIRGSAVNQDGRSNGLMAPNSQAQEAVLREAYRQAGVSPGQVQYIEAHGTGTLLGDPIEAKALGTVLAADRPAGSYSALGSVKTNIGHLEAAAGIAGLIKVALMLNHREIPPSLHFREPNPHIPFDSFPLRVSTALSPWPETASPALAGVSSFGFGGTNAHIVLEEAPRTDCGRQGQWKSQAEAACGRDNSQFPPLNPQRAFLLPLSAHSPEALQSLAHAYCDLLTTPESTGSLQDLCYTASVRRGHHDYRLAVTGHSSDQMRDALQAFLQGEACPGLASGHAFTGRRRKLVFVFPGQGSQWYGMGQKLLEQEPAFRETLERCDQLMRQYGDWSLLTELATTDEAQSRLNDIAILQPALFAMQAALAALWRSWGIEPDAVVGHSMGEVAAAYVAGALSLDDAVRVICRRSRLVKQAIGEGAMAAVELSTEEAQRVLVGYEDRASIAVSNSPTSTVLSGDPTALQEILEKLQSRNIFCRLVKVDFASHSPQMDPLRADLLQALEGLHPQPTSVLIYSTVTGEVSDGREYDASYWVRNLREPVLFSPAVQKLLEDGHDIFIEISPHPILLSALHQGFHHAGREGAALPSLRREEEGRTVMLGSLGVLYTLGYPVGWSRLYPAGGRCVRLPSYPWQREQCWLEDLKANNGRTRERSLTQRDGSGVADHPLLGQHLRSAVHSGTHFWEMELGTHSFPYLDGRRIQGMVILPASVYLEMALAAAAVFGAGPHILQKIAFKKALFLPEGGTQTVQLVVAPEMPGTASFQCLSLQAGPSTTLRTGVGQQQASWTLHTTGTIRLGQTELVAAPPEHDSLEAIQARCPEVVPDEEHCQTTGEWGIRYGLGFQGAEQIRRRDGEAIGRLHFPATESAEADAYHIHPALLDAGFQVLAATLPREDISVARRDPYVPVGLDSLRVYGRPSRGSGLWSHALLRPRREANADWPEGDVFLLDESGQVVLEALGLILQCWDGERQHLPEPDLSDWLYEIQWEREACPQRDRAPGSLSLEQYGSWLLFTDRGGVGQTLRALLEERGETCTMVSPAETYKIAAPGHYQINPARPEDFRQLLQDIFAAGHPPCRGVVHLWSLEAPSLEENTPASWESTQELGCASALHLLQALAHAGWKEVPRLWLVTRGAQAVGEESASVAVAQSPLWGLGRAVANEHPEFRCSEVDLSPVAAPAEAHALFQELWSDDQEDQIALRGDTRYVARLRRHAPVVPRETRRVVSGNQPFRLEIPTPGILDNLIFRATPRQKPGPGEVEIQVCMAGLSFSDIMKALGIYPDLPEGPVPLGAECAGRIVALGEGVEDFHIGDEVIAVAPYSFAAFVVVPTHCVVPKPSHLDFAEAATIPLAFLTAHYALHYLGRLGAGERVLIHAAAGGVGLAAVQLAQRVGAEIFATAGTPEKRDFLRSLGIQYVMDSRSLAFADEVMEYTGGEGVDVVLNSLAAEAIPKGLSILRPYGRFLEIGKRDISQNSQLGLRPFQNNLSFFAIDLDRLLRERPAFVGLLFRELMQYFKDGILHPLPRQIFPLTEVESAFRYMAQAKHTGKIVVSVQDQEVVATSSAETSTIFPPDATYLITGGLGGLGLSVAQWMVQQGARHLVLMGRSGASAATAEALESLRRTGARVETAKADVTQEQQVANVLAEIGQSMPPLRGIIHAAGILDDGILLQLDQERFRSVMAPKVSGAWNLHSLTLDMPLDFFVLFSSAASVIGSPGQGNYSAANAFLDALAHHRRTQGRPALSINWGPWSEVGAAARPDRNGRMALRGLRSIAPKQGLAVMERLLRQHPTQVVVMPANRQLWRQLYLAFGEPPLFSHLAHEDADASLNVEPLKGKGRPLRDTLLAAESEDRQQFLESYLREQVARTLGLSASRLDVQQPLNRLGVDSLMAIELRNRIETDLGVVMSLVHFLQEPSVAQLATLLLDQLPATASASPPPLPPWGKAEQRLANLDQLSDEEVSALLTEMLAEEEAHE